jgi:predicted dehydrogenase
VTPAPIDGELRLALIGVGAWAPKIVGSLPGDARVTVAVTKRADASLIAGPSATIAPDVASIAPTERIDGVMIANEASRHIATLREVWNRWPTMPVFLEKPVGLNFKDVREIAKTFPTSRDRLLLVDHVQRFNPNLIKVERSFRRSRAKRIRGVEGNAGPARNDCDTLWDAGPHAVSVALALAGFPSRSTAPQVQNARVRREATGASFSFDLLFEDVCVASLVVSNIAKRKHRRYAVKSHDIPWQTFEGVTTSSPPALSAALASFCNAVATGTAPADDERWGWSLPLEVSRILAIVESTAVRLDHPTAGRRL